MEADWLWSSTAESDITEVILAVSLFASRLATDDPSNSSPPSDTSSPPPH